MLTSSYSTYSNSPFASQARQPRAIVQINGISVYWTDIEVQTTTFYVADNYLVTIPLNNQNPTLNFNYWSSTVEMTVKIWIGFPKNPDSYGTADLELFMVGVVDLLDIDPLKATVTISGRDLSARLIDTKSSQKYPSYTASQVAQLLATKHQLKAQITPTTELVGVIFANNNVLVTKEITEWDLLTYVAQQSGFVVFLRNDTLVFEPYPKQDANSAFIIQYQAPSATNASPQFNGMDIKFRRSLTLARDVKVLVKVPFNPLSGKAFTVTAQATRRTRPYLHNVPSFVGAPQTYTFIRPGLTREQAQNTANQLLSNITLHEVIIDVTMPGDITLRKDSIIQVRGTGTSFDQFYYADVTYRRLNYREGFMQQLQGKNHSVDTEVNL
jgi:hypothetical protein